MIAIISFSSSLIFLLLMSPFNNTPINGEPLIGVGTHAVKRDYQFVVLIGEKSESRLEGKRLCTGSLISRNQVLTAASCLENKEIQYLNAFIGSSIPSPDFNVFDISSKVTYDDFTYESEKNANQIYGEINDISILELDTTKTPYDPVTISYDQNIPTVGYGVTLIGWGRSRYSEWPPKARYGSLEVLKKQDCDNKAMTFSPNYRKFSWSNKVFCARTTQATIRASDGDFGGPVLFGPNQLVGIAIRPRPIPEPIQLMNSQPILVLRLAFYKDFIQNYLHARG